MDRAAVEVLCRAEGFEGFGICAPEAGRAAGHHLKQWIADGYHGEMTWFEQRLDWRADPTELWPEARSVIMLADNYGPDSDPLVTLSQKDRATISVYARNRDYHDRIKKRLKRIVRQMVAATDCAVKVFVDTAPVMEKPLAAAAGLGWQGKHTNLVSRDVGSWAFLGAIFTTLELERDEPHPDRCGSCRACLDICPTAAFTAPYRLDARRCISYLTIEHKGPVPEEFRAALGNRIYGCDDCLAVCPWNKFARVAADAAYHARAELRAPSLAELAALDDAGFRSFFTASPIKRIGRDRFVRNVLYAIGNSGERALLPVAAERRNDESDIVRDAAGWAYQRLAALSA
jgi:epoxyqueuosine reductase